MKAKITIELEDGRTIVREVENLHYQAEKVPGHERHALAWEIAGKLSDEIKREAS